MGLFSKRDPDTIDRKPVEKNNRTIKLYMVGIALFLIIMFGSKYVLKARKQPSELGPVSYNGSQYYVADWKFDKETLVVEVVVAVEGAYSELPGIASKCEYAQSNGSEVKDGIIIGSTIDCIVVRYPAIKRFNSMLIALYVPGETIYFRESKENMAPFSYNEAKETEMVSYRVQANEYLKTKYENRIADNEKAIENFKEEQENLRKEIQEIREREAYMTANQVQTAETDVKNKKSTIDGYDQRIAEIQRTNEEYRRRIENLDKIINDIPSEENGQ